MEKFLARKIGFLDIARIVEDALAKIPSHSVKTLGDLQALDGEARDVAAALAGTVAAAT